MGKRCVAIVSVFNILCIAMLLHQSYAFRLQCRRVPQMCVVDNWNPKEEGFFLLNHLLDALSTLRMNNLMISTIGTKFLTEVSRSLHGIVVEKSNSVKRLIVPTNSSIETIKLEDTQLSRMYFEVNSALLMLIITKCPIQEIPPSVNNLTSLQKLLLSETSILAIDFNYMLGRDKINMLAVEKNYVNVLTGLTHSPNRSDLQTIKLRYSHLQTLNLDLFAPFPALKLLDISSNMLHSLTGTLANPMLTYLCLSENHILAFDLCSWNPIRTLEALTAARNRLQKVPRCLTTFAHAKTIDLSYNTISHIDMQDFSGLDQLWQLDLGGNKILRLEFGGDVLLPRFTKLHLYESCICQLNDSATVLSRMPKLKVYFTIFTSEKCTVC